MFTQYALIERVPGIKQHGQVLSSISADGHARDVSDFLIVSRGSDLLRIHGRIGSKTYSQFASLLNHMDAQQFICGILPNCIRSMPIASSRTVPTPTNPNTRPQ